MPKGVYERTDEARRNMALAKVGNTNHLGRGTHNQHQSRTYRSWSSMKSRCQNPKSTSYKYYGARGVTVCSRWESFENFFEDMGERPEGTSLDRIDPHGNYEPGNCRWATSAEQNRNKRSKACP